jgi:exodeoxyribonuclease-3
MKIAAWNVNSIRQRIQHVADWLDAAQPDVIGLQEIKVVTEQFPAEEFEKRGYHSVADGQKSYNGVALLSMREPGDVVRGLPTFEDEQKRVIAATYGSVRVVNLYAPNGQSIDSDKYQYKLRWLTALRDWLESELQRYPQLVVVGDFNIAPEDRDVHDPEEWRGQVLCSERERDKLAALLQLGFVDVFRRFEQPEKAYSWWDYRAAAFRRNRGLRIDLVLASAALASRCTESRIDVEPRRREQPSDHAPVWARFSQP